jgi:hypothetical protein
MEVYNDAACANCHSPLAFLAPSKMAFALSLIDGQREPGPPLQKKDGVVGGDVGSLGT